MNTTLNIDSAGRVLAPDEASWNVIERTESEWSLTAAPGVARAQPWLRYGRALLHVIAGVFAMLYSFGAPSIGIVLLAYMFTRCRARARPTGPLVPFTTLDGRSTGKIESHR